MSGKVTLQDHGAAELLKRVRELSGGRKVRVGVLGDESKREEPVSQRGKHSTKARTRAKAARRATEAAVGGKGKYSLLQVAIIHEFGGGHVPARSFIRATIDEKRAEIQAEQVKAARAVLLGKVTPEVALERLGSFVVGLMQARIRAGIPPMPLAKSTMKRKGAGKPTPLILTGQLVSSIIFAVEGA